MNSFSWDCWDFKFTSQMLSISTSILIWKLRLEFSEGFLWKLQCFLFLLVAQCLWFLIICIQQHTEVYLQRGPHDAGRCIITVSFFFLVIEEWEIHRVKKNQTNNKPQNEQTMNQKYRKENNKKPQPTPRETMMPCTHLQEGSICFWPLLSGLWILLLPVMG